jgi:hypothetical protein
LLASARALAVELEQLALVAAIDALGAPLPPPRPAPAPESFAMRREGDVWAIEHGGATVRLRDSRGLQVLARLVESPGHELHVLQLAAAAADDGELDRGDAGQVLDATAVQRYRARLLELREELDEAESFSDAGRSERARDEIEMLTAELARAVGLGGRMRRAGGAAERARTTVQKRLRDAIRRIGDQLPELGTYLDGAVRTGTFCVYAPRGRRR